MHPTKSPDRRAFLATATLAIAGRWNRPLRPDDRWPSLDRLPRKRVAGILTTYFKGSHADVLITRLLKGWKADDGPGPNLSLTSLYIDQHDNAEYGLALAREFNIPVFDTIAGALTAGTDSLAVDGVVSVGEHGNYPRNDAGQDLYPRRRFFDEIFAVFRQSRRVVPVFNDKHFGPRLDDALHMYQQGQELAVPMMAGSSLVVGYRTPHEPVPIGSELTRAVAIGYSELDRYGFHTLEVLQWFTERRRGGESGVRSVECLTGDAIAPALTDGRVPRDLLEAAAAEALTVEGATLETPPGPNDALFLIEHLDGLKSAVLMHSGFARSISAAVRVQGAASPIASRAEERPQPHYPHFAFLLHAVERMFHTGQPTYPVERTLLTTGILDRALTSRLRAGLKLETPELAMSYQPTDYPFAPLPPLPV